MDHLTRYDFAAALDLLAQLEARAEAQPAGFEGACAQAVADFIASSAVGCFDASGAFDGPEAADAIPSLPDAHELQIVIAGAPRPAVIVLRRAGGRFTERDRERAQLLQPHLAYLVRQARRSPAVTWPAPLPVQHALTPRESEVMRWVACGKTDADIGALLAISPRTVHKHLEHIFTKLGVETRTAAAMRAGSGAGPN